MLGLSLGKRKMSQGCAWQPGGVRCKVVAQAGVGNFAPSLQTLAVQSVEAGFVLSACGL